MPQYRIVLAIVSAIVISLAGCKVSPTAPVSSTTQITTGATKTIATQTIAVSGGTIAVSLPGDSLNGMSVIVPANSYTAARTFTITSAPITSHSLGANFNPVSPLITISNGGGYASDIMEVRIPIHVGSDQFAMAFAYDDRYGTLEAIPMSESDSTHVTALTMHFNQSALRVAKGENGTGNHIQQVADEEHTMIAVTSVSRSTLTGENYTLFHPGQDDWEFTNYGSVVKPGGHCVGMSVGMMWYFTHQRIEHKEPMLYGRFDDYGGTPTPEIWMDDDRAYKFCGMIQYSMNWQSIANSIQRILQPVSGRLTYFEFSYAFLLTHTAQLLHVFGDPTSTASHAVVAYGTLSDRLQICDPNFPGDATRFAPYASGTLGPYASGPDAKDLKHAYPSLRFMGQSALVNWDLVTDLYAHLQDGTVGDGVYPNFNITATDTAGNNVPLVDGFVTRGSYLHFQLANTSPDLMVNTVFFQDGTILDTVGGLVNLPEGKHRVGFYITDTSAHQSWAGFKWYSINTGGPENSIKPLEVGNMWIYNTSTYREDGTIATSVVDTERIISVDSSTGEKLYTYLSADGGQFKFVSRADGVWTTIDATHFVLLAKYPCAVGDIFGLYSTTALAPYDSMHFDTKVVALQQTSTVPAGSYSNCIKFEGENRTPAGKIISDSAAAYWVGWGGTVDQFDWWSVGTGMVEHVDYYSGPSKLRYVGRRRQLAKVVLK